MLVTDKLGEGGIAPAMFISCVNAANPDGRAYGTRKQRGSYSPTL